MRRVWLGIFVLIFGMSTSGFAALDIPQGKHCVAWKAKKTVFLMSDQEPVGLNCSILVELKGEELHVRVPIAGFNSAEEDRDASVTELLGGPTHKEVVFKTILPKGWRDSISNMTTVDGSLMVKGKPYPIKATIMVAGGFVRGAIKGTLSQFDIEPPSVAGGIVADVDDYLELQYSVALSKIK